MNIYKMTIMHIEVIVQLLKTVEQRGENEVENNISYLNDIKKSIEKLIGSLQKEVN